MGARGQIPRRVFACLSYLAVLAALALGTLGSVGTWAGQSVDSAELSTRETQPTFRLQVERNVVLIRAVVRDAQGRAVTDLRKEDFRVLDNGKPQTIAHFAVEAPSTMLRGTTAPSPPEVDAELLPETALAPSTPQRYLALYFDDVHMEFAEVARTRDAAERYLQSALQPGDRAGIFTSSGQIMVDFTDDQTQLRAALARLLPRPVASARNTNTCPEISDYQAYLIVHQRDRYATEIAVEETIYCYYSDPNLLFDPRPQATMTVEAEAMRVLSSYQTESEHALRGIEQLVRRVAQLPGQRSIVLVSPGFLMLTLEYRVSEIIDRALRSNVIIHSLDAKGLFAPIPFGDASRRPVIVPTRADLMGRKTLLLTSRLERAAEVLRAVAYDTGGEFFHNNNDFDQGFRKVGGLPEGYYILGFSPQILKLDGRFHKLKVELNKPGHFAVQARRGYYAPKKPLDTSVQAKEEIEQAIFSQEELNELPVDVHTQFFKVNELDTKLAVVTHLDVRLLQFRKEEGRNLNHLTVVTVLFDRDGRYLIGKEKLLDLRLRDISLEKISDVGITLKTSFDVKPGTYMVRQVVRDTEGAQLSALSRTVEIPL